ncbi:MAG: hypothetical protein KDI71_14615 [Xanthomonadales bacterium]|nr:hypothetical protein [Xanthomonadales bacterium]
MCLRPFLLLALVSASFQTTFAADAGTDVQATASKSQSGSGWIRLWQGLDLSGLIEALPPAQGADPERPEQTLAQREAELNAIAEQNRAHQQRLEDLAEVVRQRDAELARRDAEQAALAERLARLEAAMNTAPQEQQ